ncbi:UDP-N-acetylmuramate dehydrogenase [Helicobacter jaachi]|uniref:UDP-N-acetylenolpyruvoylglucosamine reductase n=1 Tax=Helicobacter jaachi TaxID=1677920 RepID=A0A4U8T8V6_9HELI|nr:UDP-N-acetylmuramate dehydrogenase [Helicobacter jaachi]TLD96043.1 UDP-N-acetylmuramate dehydrogenase [Helicobacter jaachi]
MQTRLINFATYSSLKIGSTLEVSLIQTLQDATFAHLQNLTIIGQANNLLISPTAQHLAMLDKNFAYIKDCYEDSQHLIEIGGAYSSGRIFHYFKAHNLSGAEFLQALPGSLGGLVKMNAGMKRYEIKQLIHSVNINGEWHNIESIPMNYRDSGINGVILAARFYKNIGFNDELQKMFNVLRKAHPKEPSCGSCFKNPKGDFAGRLLESVGLKGYSIGDAAFSQKHANFLINKGNATFADAISLIELAKKRVFEASGITLACEVCIVQ